VSDPFFLTLDEVLGIHADQIRRYGGRPGLQRVEVHTFFLTHGSPWKNDNIESFNGKLRNALLDREID